MTGEKVQPSPICYIEIPAPDVEKAAAFYRSVFGWAVTESSLSDQPYSTFSTGEGGFEGGFDSRKSAQAGGVLLYLKVEDLAATLKTIAEAGGSVVGDKSAVGGDFGFFAIFKDPNGNHLGIWARE